MSGELQFATHDKLKLIEHRPRAIDRASGSSLIFEQSVIRSFSKRQIISYAKAIHVGKHLRTQIRRNG